MSLVLKCKNCGEICSDDYYQVTHRYKVEGEKRADVVDIFCPKCLFIIKRVGDRMQEFFSGLFDNKIFLTVILFLFWFIGLWLYGQTFKRK